MDAKGWRKKIKKQCETLGTMRDEFIPVIESLANILEERDRAYQAYIDDGARPTIMRISDRGSENPAKNPLLTTWMDLNNQALTFYRDLGLTPAGLKKLNDNALKVEKKTSFADVLASIGI